ncbi:MAG TPA: ABC transporter substrate-binding protein [Bradyrhizobium sp.]|nr:ABC transporter substrate-binding protein [Bradyrhizobium sp.]
MRRREFISLIGGAAASVVSWPVAAQAQQSATIPVVGFLHSATPEPSRIAAFRKGLSDAGFIEGKDVAIEHRWAQGNYARLPELAQDLVGRNVAVIVAAGGIASAPAAKAATDRIPIVLVIGSDPVADGLVKSLARPEGNITGVSFLTQALGAKRLGFLNVLVPHATDIAIVLNPNNRAGTTEVQAAAKLAKKTIHVFEARTAQELESAFDAIARGQAGAVMVHSDPFFTSRAAQISALGTKTNKPTIYPSREYAEAGGLVFYGADVRDEYRKAGDYVARLLRGAKPADLPISQPTKFELVLNLKTAKTLGLNVPDSFQLLADEVIE